MTINSEQLTKSNGDNDVIEMRIINAVKKILEGRVNEIINDYKEAIPIIEFGEYQGKTVITPVITLAYCEKTEKERIIRLDAYTLTINFALTDTVENLLHCLLYSGAVIRSLNEDITLGGVVNRCEVTGKKIIPPKNPNSGEGWDITITLRLTVEEMNI